MKLTDCKTGEICTAELWIEGISAHTRQRETKLETVYRHGNDEITADKAALTVVGVEKIEWTGKKNGFSEMPPGSGIYNCESDTLDSMNGSYRVFPGARQSDFPAPPQNDPNYTPPVPKARDTVEFTVHLTVPPPRGISIWCRSFDADDPASDGSVDPNDYIENFSTPKTVYCEDCPEYTVEEDNRGEVKDESGNIIGTKAGWIVGSQPADNWLGKVTVKAGSLSSEEAAFQTTMNSGDNFVIAANADKDFLMNCANRDYTGDGDRVFNRTAEGGGTGKEILKHSNYTNSLL